MSFILIQPFSNPYSLVELEKTFGMNLDLYTKREIDKYRFENKGRLAKDVAKLEKSLLEEKGE